jgi:hypothetical protein
MEALSQQRARVRLLNDGAVPRKQLGRLLQAPTPPVLRGKQPIAKLLQQSPNAWGIPPGVWRLEPEVLLLGTDHGLCIVRRGWWQGHLKKRAESGCDVFLDFRTGVRERKAGKNKPYGETSLLHRSATVKVEGQVRSLYVLVALDVVLNSSRFGEKWEESNSKLAKERRDAGLPTGFDALPRWFVVSHELAHAKQILDAMRAAIDPLLQNICQPPRPNAQDKARIEKAIDDTWEQLGKDGHAGAGTAAGYDENPIEEEARRRAWREADHRAQGTFPFPE